jgi:hypothetical protein
MRTRTPGIKKRYNLRDDTREEKKETSADVHVGVSRKPLCLLFFPQ